jgi:hypothetical protein
MDAYTSEEQVMSCDAVDVLHTDIIQPGHKTICGAMETQYKTRQDKNRGK